MRIPVLLLCWLCCPAWIDAQDNVTTSGAEWTTEQTAQLDTFLETLHRQQQFNGAVLLAENGEMVYEKYLGYADIDAKRQLDPESSFRLASVSKQFTAMGIMLLKEQGKLDYDDDIRQHLPGLPYEGITIRHLLHHTGGLPDYVTWFHLHWDTDKPLAERKTAFNRDVVEQFSIHQPDILFSPGERWDYSNTGYVLLGHIIEQASGQTVQEFLQKHIFQPLQMNDSQAFSTADDFMGSKRVHGFAYLADGMGHEANDWSFMNGMVGDGGIYASARDLLKWDQALYNEALVKQATLNEAFAPGKTNDQQKTDYGFGWIVSWEDDQLVEVSHSGGWVGFLTYIVRDLKNKRTMIVLTNHSSHHFDKLLRGITTIRKGKKARVPDSNIAHVIAKTIESDGILAAVEQYRELKKNHKREYDFASEHLVNLADLYQTREDFETASSLYRLCLEENPDLTEAHEGLGVSLIEMGKQHLEKVLQQNPGNTEVTELLMALGEELEKPPTLTAEEASAYVGDYELFPGFVLSITQEDANLFGQATGQPRLKIKPFQEDKFFVDGVEAQISFQRAENGTVESLTLHQGGMDQPAKRVEPKQDDS